MSLASQSQVADLEHSFPYEFSIYSAGSDSRPYRVLCRALLRTIPGNREVFDAECEKKPSIVKVFSRGLKARARLMREWNGLVGIRQLGINAPEPIIFGKTENGRWAMATEKIAGAETVLDAFKRTDNKEVRNGLLMRICVELANQHEKGILQKDLHLGNFLLNKDGIYSIDTAQVRFFSGPVGRKQSVPQLALLTNNFRHDERKGVLSVWREYFSRRNWEFSEADERQLWKLAGVHKRNWINRTLKKCLRTSKKYIRIRKGDSIGVFCRELSGDSDPAEFLRDIERLAEGGEELKKGNTSCVRRIQWKGRDIVIKHYNHKGFIHSLRHSIKGSRARQSWLHGHRLTWLGIPTPKPLAYIEQRKWGIVWQSYLISEYIEGQNLGDVLNSSAVDDDRRRHITERVLSMIDALHNNGITHRDLKPSNIRIAANGPVLTDLDAMKVHKLKWMAGLKGRRYIERFRQGIKFKNR